MAELIQQLKGSKLLPAFVLALALAVLGVTIYAGASRLRRSVRAQIINRDGDILYNVALAQQFASEAPGHLGQRLQSPADQLALALNISQLKEGVLAVRLYDAQGRAVTAFPPYVSDAALSGSTLAELRALRPRSLYLGAAPLADLFLTGEFPGPGTNVAPLLEVNIPIHAQGEKQLLASAQLILDGRPLETEFAKLDSALWRQAGLSFLAGGALLSATLLWAYRRLQRSHMLLRERTACLLRANHELTLAAKTGALGAVTAHLVHGLSNPLANLQGFVAAHGKRAPEDTDWQDAVHATQRMQKLVHEVVRVLGEENAVDQYEITLSELADVLYAKVQPMAQEAGVPSQVRLSAQGTLGNRAANLVLLILENLVHNALQVTPRGQPVRVSMTTIGDEVVCEVSDAGPGFPTHLLKSVFTPCRSTQGGSGLGLAISRQLASHLGARLELKSTSTTGCVFALSLPAALLAGEPKASPGPVPAPSVTPSDPKTCPSIVHPECAC